MAARFDGANVEVGDHTGVLASGPISAPITLAARFWGQCMQNDGPIVAPTATFGWPDEFRTIARYLLSEGHTEEALLVASLASPYHQDSSEIEARREYAEQSGLARHSLDRDPDDQRRYSLVQVCDSIRHGLAGETLQVVEAAKRLCETTKHFGGNTDFDLLHRSCFPLLSLTARSEHLRVRELRLIGLEHLAKAAYQSREYERLEPLLGPLITAKVNERENLARLFEVQLYLGHRTTETWARCESLSTLWTVCLRSNIFETPQWCDREMIAMTRAGEALLGVNIDRAAFLLDRALSLAPSCAGNGFVHKTFQANGRLAESADDWPKALGLYERALDKFHTEVTRLSAPSELEEAIVRTRAHMSSPTDHQLVIAVNFVSWLVECHKVEVKPNEIVRVAHDLKPLLAQSGTPTELCDFLLSHSSIVDLFVSDEEMGELLANFM